MLRQMYCCCEACLAHQLLLQLQPQVELANVLQLSGLADTLKLLLLLLLRWCSRWACCVLAWWTGCVIKTNQQLAQEAHPAAAAGVAAAVMCR
jgi:hypothetical protein